ncbi:Hypothetical predicted protein [Mytilus galloprovincialis]|uniref:Uncharacterized protein n=1 Tax=Mytilus galloprovincialis TaxID=29158 RepID=A0A8B6CST9_MYTGA|nr:Hypothetical predicted protein [Mytilus galloprovincialis]
MSERVYLTLYPCKNLTQEDDTEDADYSLSVDQVESDSDNFDISTCYTGEQKLIKENDFIVFESAIDTLINKLKCNICECPVDPDDISEDLSNGTVITITAFYTSRHIVVKWSSQPFHSKMPVGNLLGNFFKQCAHTPIEPEVSDTKKWLVHDSNAQKALKEIVLDKRLRKDIRQLNEFCHTVNLEVFHSLLLKYTPKRQDIDNDQMWTRTAFAVIDHNLNQNRGQTINNDVEKAYTLVCLKAIGQWVAKPVFNDKIISWYLLYDRKCVGSKRHNDTASKGKGTGRKNCSFACSLKICIDSETFFTI